MLIDSHCHLDFPDFADELDAIVERARAAGVARMVTISTRVARQPDLLAIAERFAGVYCSVGTHPHYAHEELDLTVADLVAHTRHRKVVAIGEAGLDYHYDNSPREAQERGFRNHIAAARETGLRNVALLRGRRGGSRGCDPAARDGVGQSGDRRSGQMNKIQRAAHYDRNGVSDSRT